MHLLSMMAYDGSWSGLLASALAWLHRLVGGGGSGGGSGGERCGWASASSAGGPVERGRVVGAKIFTDHLPQHGLSLQQVLDTLGHDDTYVVVLYRRRLLDTYISLESAFRTGEWAATSDGEHGRVLAAHEARVELDLAAFHEFCDEQRWLWGQALQDLAAHHRSGKVHVLSYGHLVDDMKTHVSAVCDFVGLDPAPLVAHLERSGPGTVRQSRGTLADRISIVSESAGLQRHDIEHLATSAKATLELELPA